MLGFPAGSPGEVGLVGGLLLGLRLLELLLTAAQPFPPRPNVDQLGRQLIATYLPEPLIFGGVRIGGFGEHPVDLQADRCVTARRAWRGAAREQAAVERDHAHRHQPGPRAQRQHLREGRRERLFVPTAKARDRGVIRDPIRGDHAEGDILATTPLDPSARALTDRVRVQQKRDHHRRLERRPTPAVRAVGAVESAQIDLLHGVEHKPREVILRQPLAKTRRKQQLLIAITLKEVLRHDTPPVDRTLTESSMPPQTTNPRRAGVCATASERAFFEADDEARTRDPQLGKLMLYQLSYVRATRILAPVF